MKDYPTVPHETIYVADTLQSAIAQAADSVKVDTLSSMIAQEDVITDTIISKEQTDTAQTIRKMEKPYHEITNRFPGRTAPGHTPKWSLELAYAGQFDKRNSYDQPYTYKPKPLPVQSDPSTCPTIPSSIDNWSDYAVYLANNQDAAILGHTPAAYSPYVLFVHEGRRW